jgi:hypothetical protein
VLIVEFISETLTDDAYFSIVPPIIARLLEMQMDASFLVRAKAQSVFRACVEQLEMYKDTSVYHTTVRDVIDTAMAPWVASLRGSLAIDMTTLSGETFDEALKLKYASYKVRYHSY